MPTGRLEQFEGVFSRLFSVLSSLGQHVLDRHSFRATICAAALIGFLYGALVDPLWSEAVEFGQVWAGTVKYDPCNTWYPAVLFSPSLQITLPGLLLSAGLDPWYLSMLFTGLFCATAFAAVSAATFCFSSSAALALCAPFVPLASAYAARALGVPKAISLARVLLDRHAYPVDFPVGYWQFGQTGLYLALLSMALIAAGRYRSGAFFGGLLTGVHLVWAVAFVLAAVPAVQRMSWRSTRIFMANFSAAVILVLGLVGLSHWVFPPRVDTLCTSTQMASPTLNSAANPSSKEGGPLRSPFFVHNPLFADTTWPLAAAVKFFLPDVLLVLAAVAWMTVAYRRGADRDWGLTLLVMAAVPIGAAALFKLVEELDPTFYVLAWLDPRLPSLVLRLIVTRWLNLSSVLLPIVALSTLFILTQGYRLWWTAGLAALFAVSVLVFTAGALAQHRFLGRDEFSPLAAVAREDTGQLIISPGVVGTKGFNPQLRTGRAIIVSTSYVPTMSVVSDDRHTKIAVFCYPDYSRSIYEFFDKVRPCFEGRSEDEWRLVAQKLPATGLITPSDWRVSLPLAATAGGFNYYRLPQ